MGPYTKTVYKPHSKITKIKNDDSKIFKQPKRHKRSF